MNKILIIFLSLFVSACATKKDAVNYLVKDEFNIVLVSPPVDECSSAEHSLGVGIFDIYEAGIVRAEQLKECKLFNERKKKWIDSVCERSDINCNK